MSPLDRSAATIGREAELAAIAEALEEARRGRGSCLFLVGEAGSGKTRLLQEAAASAAHMRMNVLAGEAPHTLKPPPFGTIASAFRSWTRRADPPVDELRAFAAGLRRILPEWPSEEGPEITPDQLRLLVLEAALRLMLAAARPYGAVMLLDDLHEADPETVEVVHHVAGSIATAPLVVIAAMRPGHAGSAEREARNLEQRGHAALIDVVALSTVETRRLIEALVGAPPPDELVEEVMKRTDGVPLLVEETLRVYREGGTITADVGEVRWKPSARPLVPPTIVQSVRRRLAGLPADARSVVGAAAALASFDDRLLSAVAGLPEPQLAEAIERAVEADLLDQSRGVVTFRHALVMDAVAEALVPVRKTEFHRRAADALEQRYADDPEHAEERARHLEACGRTNDAAAMLLVAAEHGLATDAPASAESATRRALALEPAGPVRHSLVGTHARALTALGRWEEALRIDSEAEVGDEPVRLLRMARNALRSTRLDEADALVARAESSGGAPGPCKALAGLVALWRGDNERAVALSSEALEHGRRAADIGVVCDALDVTGRAKDALGHRDEAVADFRRWADLAERAGRTSSYLQALMELGNVEYMGRGSPDTLRLVRERSRAAGAYTTMVLADLSLTWCLGCSGPLSEALDAAEEALDYCRRFGLDLLSHAMVGLGWIMGRVEPGSGEGMSVDALAVAPDDPDVELLVHENRADSCLRTGRYEEAVEHYERGWEVMRSGRSQLPAMTAFVRVCALMAAGRKDEARRALDEARRSPARMVVTSNAFWLAVGEALVAGDGDALDRELRPTDAWAFERALAGILGAEVLGGRGAARWVRDSLNTFVWAGAETDAARARALLRKLGAPVPRARQTAAVPEPLRFAGVTGREAEVLRLVGEGRSNQQIAESLYLSVRTVESHVSSLLSKLEVEGRPALIARALAMHEDG